MPFGIAKQALLAPTPLEYLPTLSKELGIALYCKRDDLTPFGAGGNKLRKLEYLAQAALDSGATMLLTVGGAQTNHGRLTAAVAAKLGLKCAIVAIDNDPGEVSANLLLDRIMGCDVIIRPDDGREESEQFDELCPQIIARYEAQGERVFFIPMGGSNALGALGYYDCAVELTQQAKQKQLADARVITAVGSMGTYMGLYCGFANEASPLRLTGIAISPFGDAKEKRIVEYFREMKAAYALPIDACRADFDIEKGYTRGAYNNADETVRRAIYRMARAEAILLDPCYTGKAFAGLLEMVAEGKLARGETVIFLHTGGMPGLYTRHHREAFEKELLSGVTIL